MKPIVLTVPATPMKAITIFPFIFLERRRPGWRYHYTEERLLNHEKIHWQQQKELWVLPFYLIYGWFYLTNRLSGMGHTMAYRAVPFENEAYTHDWNITYLNDRPKHAWRRY